MSEKTSIFSESEYREFSVRVKRLEELKVEFAYEVEYLKEDNTYKVTVYHLKDGTFKVELHGEHDFEELDKLTNSGFAS